MIIANLIISTFLASPVPFFRPDQPIICPNYLPGTNTRVPRGVVYQYSPTELRAHLLRCYCETVKTTEDMCIRAGYVAEECQQKTARWIEENLPLAATPQNQGGDQQQNQRRNIIINVQVRP